jgi:DNA repair exonuclease SbcCD nuclease subunit
MSFKIMCLADLHLTEKKPPCRPDDENWLDTIGRKIDFMISLCKKHEVDMIVVAGDVFDSVGKCSHEFMTFCIHKLKQLAESSGGYSLIAIPGNHDLINADHDRLNHTPYGVLEACGILASPTVPYREFGVMPYGAKKYTGKQQIVIGHYGLWLREKPYPGAPDEGNVEWFVNNCLPKSCKLFITGHYHVPFVTKIRDTVVVNCGCPFRMRADLIDYTPYVTVVKVDDDWTVHHRKYHIPLDCEIRRDYIDKAKKQDEDLDEMIGNISGDFEVDFKFRDNFYKLSNECEHKEEINKEFERCVNGYYVK